MAGAIDRRAFIASATAAAGALALSARLPAQALTVSTKSARILDIARREAHRNAASLWRLDIVGVADFGAHSSQPRLHFANLEAGTVTSYLVAHGAGSDPERDGWLHWFSNEPGSNASSRGAYVTATPYYGKHGRSQRLIGLDPENNAALDRAIVIHGASYVDPAWIDSRGRIGRSFGCFAVEDCEINRVMGALDEGRLLYAGKSA